MKKKWMDKFKKILTPLIIFLVLVLAFYVIKSNIKETPENITKCIGKKAELYTQAGCPHCILQKQEFGENYKYLNVIDCFYEREKCTQKEITGTPTWIIQGEKYIGFQSFDLLKNLTGC